MKLSKAILIHKKGKNDTSNYGPISLWFSQKIMGSNKILVLVISSKISKS